MNPFLIYLFISGGPAGPYFPHFCYFLYFYWKREVAHLFILLPAALLALTYLFILFMADPPGTLIYLFFSSPGAGTMLIYLFFSGGLADPHFSFYSRYLFER